MRTEDVLETADGVQLSMVTHYVPILDAPPQPSDCDYLRHLRIKPIDSPDDPSRADAVIVLLPGAIAGARSLQPVGRNVIRTLRAAGITAEFWAFDRRANGVEDHSPIPVALAEGNYRVALDYYYRGAAVGGRTFAGFQSQAGLGFLAEYGLARTVEDMYEILRREIPDADVRAERVFLGGHSLGGFQAGAYASWDFPNRPGHEQIAGLIALDTVTSMDPADLATDRRWLGRAVAPLGVGLGAGLPRAMRWGLMPRSSGAAPTPMAEMFALLATVAAAARMAPDEETEIPRLLPQTPLVKVMGRGSTARTWREFMRGSTDLRDFRLTNQALLGLLGGAHTSVALAVLSMSCGTLDSAAVAPRSFPLPFEASTVPGVRHVYQAGLGTQPRLSPTSHDELYRWRSYDRCGTPDAPVQLTKHGIPCSTASGEIVDITELAGILSGGTLNVFEDYFPVRQTTDVGAAVLGYRGGSLAPIKHEHGAAGLPRVNLMGASSFTHVLANLGPGATLFPADSHWLPGYLHCDVSLGAFHRPDGMPEPVSSTLAAFVGETLAARADGRRPAAM